uniref:CapB n=1 Tax=Capnodium sp. TTI-000886 TaxID=3078996 RepID=A0AA96MPI1_9PEZI|nr:CapB [Capnodium sp. TTI-000886]
MTSHIPPSSQRALKVQGPGTVVLEKSCPVPLPQPNEVLIRIVCAGINPFDWKSLDMSPSPGSTWGCDFSGEVIQLGDDVSSRFQLGDHVGGTSPGNSSDDPAAGAFAEYASVPEDLLFKMPAWMTFEQAATLGCGMLTIGLSLYHVLKLPLPYEKSTMEPRFVLVYGGGTATGTLAIQALRLSGMMPITTCSPHNFSRVKDLGAVEAWDYHSPSCAGDIRAFTKDKLEYALDCITDSGSMKICYSAIGSAGGKYVGLDQFPVRGHTRRNVRPEWIIAWTVRGKPINWKKPYRRDAKPKDKKFGERWLPISQQLLDSGDIKTHPLESSDDGLAGIIEGADRLRKGVTGGRKLVYRIGQ